MSTAHLNGITEDLEAAFVAAGVDASPVQNSPVHAVNVWPVDPHSRVPETTVVVDGEGFHWGPNYGEHAEPGAHVREVVRSVRASLGRA